MLYLSLGQHLLWILIPWKLKLLSTTKPVVMPTGYRWSFSAFLPIVFFIAFALFLCNPAGIIIFVALFFWDNKKEEEQLAQTSRNETLSRLPLRLSTKRVVELVQLRDTVRPETVSLAIQKAERFRTELLRRGVLLAPVIWGQAKAPQITKKGFGNRSKAAPSLPSIGVRWMEDQQKSEGVTPGEDVYIILRLDGRVRISGKGMPDWQQIVKELPPMEALLSKL
ncbi:hypothetical protein RHMOL_Rhmol01G0375800 [Rhododendron molle]|uniref:Uncharacterized protein n=1 Tax=Rhododendron molle TaxID=49168 RepID=A0ACC0Q9K4_RHOML|nr:hypothetical protein RHMOL_Rhmol01G0375800 [Rhododendron molle]